MQVPFTTPPIAVEDILVDGRGLARFEGKVIFVPDALPGDVVVAEVYRKKRGTFEGRVLERIETSPFRETPVCSHFGVCGGCKWQHLAYPQQLHFKAKQVRDALERIGGVESAVFHPIVGCDSPYYYRNKLEFSFSNRRWVTPEDPPRESLESRVGGFHVPRFFDKVLPIETCHLQDIRVNAVRNAVVEWGRNHSLSFYDARAQHGFLRNLVFRSSLATGELMTILIVGSQTPDALEPLVAYLLQTFPFITSLASILNPKPNDSYADLPVTLHHGPSFLTEQLGRYTFGVSPTSFFQTNTRQAERLYQLVYEAIGAPVRRLYDLYCGAGTIGIYVSELAKEIIGLEYVATAVSDAHANTERNRLAHLRFQVGDIARLLDDGFLRDNGAPDVVVTDPPRAGMHPAVVAQLLRIQAPVLIYVSCNPATQARDIQLLSDRYTVTDVTPVDMFPQTSHVESVARLVLR